MDEVIERNRLDYVQAHVDNIGLPARYAGVKVQDWLIEDDDQEIQHRKAHARASAVNYIKAFDPKVLSNMIFYGTVGTGKTHLAAAMAKAIAGHKNAPKGNLVRMVNFSELCRAIKNSFGSKDINQISHLKQYLHAAFLVLDDVGIKPLTAYEHDLLNQLIDERYNAFRSTLITTNLTPDAFGVAMNNRITDRLTGIQGVEFFWDSMRSKSCQINAVYAAKEIDGNAK